MDYSRNADSADLDGEASDTPDSEPRRKRNEKRLQLFGGAYIRKSARMPLRWSEGVLMDANTRNTKVIAALIASMSVGAVVLLALETKPNLSPAPLLMAEEGQRVDGLRIEVLPADQAYRADAFDGCIELDGRCRWRPSGPNLRIAVLGRTAQALSEAQAGTLMKLLGSLVEYGQLDLNHVAFVPPSDPADKRTLAVLATDVRTLLRKKGVSQ